jgi:putative transposase
MRLTAQEKQEIIWMVERSEIGVNRSLLQLGIAKSTFYKWYKVT